MAAFRENMGRQYAGFPGLGAQLLSQFVGRAVVVVPPRVMFIGSNHVAYEPLDFPGDFFRPCPIREVVVCDRVHTDVYHYYLRQKSCWWPLQKQKAKPVSLIQV